MKMYQVYGSAGNCVAFDAYFSRKDQALNYVKKLKKEYQTMDSCWLRQYDSRYGIYYRSTGGAKNML